MQENILKLMENCKNSSFNRHSFETSIDISEFIASILLHTWRTEAKAKKYLPADDINFNKIWLDRVTPKFQRDNNKWSLKMKTKFIENLLMGAKVELLFFRLKEFDDAQVIDGLQRTTAILDFFNGKVKPFGYKYEDLEDDFHKFSFNARLKIYTFDNWKEVGNFYIDMNEGITHCKKDIQKAKDWFLAEYNIEL